jgi:D-tyrosyl-tRNA(Tyr) deacylase
MRTLIQRVSHASVSIDGTVKDEIKTGVLVLVGIEEADDMDDVCWSAAKIVNLRIFPDEEGVMNRSLLDIKGQVLVISQFTLHAKTKKGNRPSYIRAARPEQAIPLYEAMISEFSSLTGQPTGSGKFGADMQVSLCNDGPVTIWIDTKNKE